MVTFMPLSERSFDRSMRRMVWPCDRLGMTTIWRGDSEPMFFVFVFVFVFFGLGRLNSKTYEMG